MALLSVNRNPSRRDLLVFGIGLPIVATLVGFRQWRHGSVTSAEVIWAAGALVTLVFAGVQTNVCVETSLRDAYSLGFNVAVAADCVASHTAELHEATLKNARFLLGDVLSGREIASFWPPRA